MHTIRDPLGRQKRAESRDDQREQVLERLSALVDRLLYDLALIMSGRRAELEAYVDREIADRIRTTLQLFLDSGDVVRPDFGPYAEVRIEGDLLRGADPVSVWVDFENRSTREDPDGRLRALPRHRVRVRLQVVPALQQVSGFSLQLGREPQVSPLPTGPSQHLPIPIGGADPAHLPRTRRAGRPRWRTVMLGCGMITAAAGTWLTVTAGPTAVYSDADGVHVGASVLRLQHADGELTVYAGDAALVVRRMAGAVVGSAVTTVHGRHVTGVCRLVGAGAGVSETCAFHQGSRTLTSRDRFDAPAHQWVRRYDGGRETRIAVPAQARLVPVPFVIGVDFA